MDRRRLGLIRKSEKGLLYPNEYASERGPSLVRPQFWSSGWRSVVAAISMIPRLLQCLWSNRHLPSKKLTCSMRTGPLSPLAVGCLSGSGAT